MIPINPFKVLRRVAHCDNIIADVLMENHQVSVMFSTKSMSQELTGEVQVEAVLFVAFLLFTNEALDCVCHLNVRQSI